MKITFNEWIKNKTKTEGIMGWILGNDLPPMNPEQKKQYVAMMRTGMGKAEALRILGLDVKPIKNPLPGEQMFQSAFKSGADEFSSPERMALNKAPTITR